MGTGIGVIGSLAIVVAAAAAGEIPVRRHCREAALVVVGRIVSVDDVRTAGTGSDEPSLSFARAEIAVEQVLKGPSDLHRATLRWIHATRTGEQEAVGLWGRGGSQTQRFRLGDHGLWFLHRVRPMPPTYACPGSDRFIPSHDGAYRGTVETARLALSIRIHPAAPIGDGLQLTLETSGQGALPAEGPVLVRVGLRNVGRIESGAAVDPAGTRIVYKLDADLFKKHSTAEVRINGTRKHRLPMWIPSGESAARETVALILGAAQSGEYDLSGWLPAGAGLYKIRLISQPPGCPRLTSNWIWICRDITPTGGLVLVSSTYSPRGAASGRTPMLKVSVINVTDAQIAIPKVDQRLFTEWTRGGITDDRDRNVPWKPTFDEPEIAIHERLRLAPGAMRTLIAPLARLAEFKQAGRYTLQLRCRMPGVGLLVGNRVAFEVKGPGK